MHFDRSTRQDFPCSSTCDCTARRCRRRSFQVHAAEGRLEGERITEVWAQPHRLDILKQVGSRVSGADTPVAAHGETRRLRREIDNGVVDDQAAIPSSWKTGWKSMHRRW
jgi:hypothetical protein